VSELGEVLAEIKQVLKSQGPQIVPVEYTPEQYAQGIKDFYDALLKFGIDKKFAQKIVIAFAGRP